MQRTKFPSRQETAALGSSATDLPGPPQKRLLPVDPEFIPKKTTHAFSHRREEAWVFYEFAMLKGKRCPHTAQKMGYVRTKKTPENYERYEKEKPAIKWSRNIGRNAPIQPAFRIGSKYYIYYMGNIAKCQENLVNYPRLKP